MAVLQGRREAIVDFLKKTQLGLDGVGEIWRLLLAMCKSERELFRDLTENSPGVELFVHPHDGHAKPVFLMINRNFCLPARSDECDDSSRSCAASSLVLLHLIPSAMKATSW